MARRIPPFLSKAAQAKLKEANQFREINISDLRHGRTIIARAKAAERKLAEFRKVLKNMNSEERITFGQKAIDAKIRRLKDERLAAFEHMRNIKGVDSDPLLTSQGGIQRGKDYLSQVPKEDVWANGILTLRYAHTKKADAIKNMKKLNLPKD